MQPKGVAEPERPLAVDLCTGLHGWAEGLVSEGWRVRGYDIEDMCAATGDPRPEYVELVLQSILDLHGADCADAALIVASPPCQEYSYMAMPWSRAKAKAAAIRADETGESLKRLTALFDACFRIQRQASEAAGWEIPMVVENVRGAEPWVGRARWNFGSYYLWGDVPALMPRIEKATKVPGFRFDGSGRSFQTASVNEGIKGSEGYERTYTCGKPFGWKKPGTTSKGSARKAASARIAKIPLTLSQHVARWYRLEWEARQRSEGHAPVAMGPSQGGALSHD